MDNFNIEKVKSILTMKSIFISSFSFKRNNSKSSIITSDSKMKLEKSISEISDNTFNVSLSIDSYNDDYSVSLTVSGIFSVNNVEANKSLIFRNTISILFPYLRSELTLLTSQPNFEPIILPPININTLFEIEEKK